MIWGSQFLIEIDLSPGLLGKKTTEALRGASGGTYF
jgi:hypothetical protein